MLVCCPPCMMPGLCAAQQAPSRMTPFLPSTCAVVACRQMGFDSGEQARWSGDGDGDGKLTNILCIGNETSIDECPISYIPAAGLPDLYVAGISCSNGTADATDGDVRLEDCTYGQVLVARNGAWGGVCIGGDPNNFTAGDATARVRGKPGGRAGWCVHAQGRADCLPTQTHTRRAMPPHLSAGVPCRSFATRQAYQSQMSNGAGVRQN